VACRGKTSVAGRVHVGGGGGAGGFYNASTQTYWGGGGGGAGGQVLLEGRSVEVSGELFANGGAGGGGKPDSSPTATGQKGRDSRADTACAPGGLTTSNGGPGGAGGCNGQPPLVGGRLVTNATDVSLVLSTAGGGGGSVGFLRTATPAGVAPMLSPTKISPAFSANETLETY
jgi:hypothetical protein